MSNTEEKRQDLAHLAAHVWFGAMVPLAFEVVGMKHKSPHGWQNGVAIVVLFALLWEVGMHYATLRCAKPWPISALGMLTYLIGAGLAAGVVLIL